MERIICNKCGKEIETRQGIAREDFIKITKPWGYFSKKDGWTQEFVLCEDCVGKMVENFTVPSNLFETTEMI